MSVPLPPEVKVHSIHPSIEGGVSTLEAVAIPEQETTSSLAVEQTALHLALVVPNAVF